MNNDWNRPSGEQQRPATQPGTAKPTTQQKPGSTGTGERTANGEKQTPKTNVKSRRKRPTWQRVMIGIAKYVSIPLLICAAIAVGLYIGYVKLGDRPSNDMLNMETWKHMFDLIFSGSG